MGQIALEIAITFSPIFLIGAASYVLKSNHSLFADEEWYFVAAVMFAQAISKFAAAIRGASDASATWLVVAIVATIIAGIIPSTLFAVWSHGIQNEPLARNEPGWIKCFLVTLSILTFSWAAGVSHIKNSFKQP